MSKIVTKESVNERLKDRGITLIGEYIDSKTKTLFQCKCGHTWQKSPNKILSGMGCIKCAIENNKLPKEVIIERINKTNITIIGDIHGLNVNTEFECVNGHRWHTTPSGIISGRGCMICGGKAPLSKEIVNERIKDKGIKIIGDYVNTKTKTKFECQCGYIYDATPGSVMKNGCPKCANSLPLSKEIVNERIIDRGIQIVGKYYNTQIKTEFKCVCGNIWKARPNKILSGNGCPNCADYGFNKEKPAWIYILIFANFIKYGITNDLTRRLNEHKRSGDYSIATTKLYEDGSIPQKWESNIKIIFGGRYVSKEIMSNGWTETLSRDKLEALLDTIK